MIIVMTGGTSGIGAEALNNFVKTSNNKVYVGARGSGRSVTDGASLLPLNLSSLKSVRAFAENIKEILGNNKIDSLVLNAGIQASDGKTLSEDGFELTFATNHLAHYLLVNLLLPNVSDEGRIIITTSDAHDPEVVFFGPKTLNPKTLARPDNGRSKGMKLYAETKLCNLLMARSLQKLMVDQKKDITVVAYNPGLTGNTSLMGQQSAFMKILFRVIFRPLFYIISIFKPQFYMGTAQRSGEVLAQLGLGKIKLPFGKIYASLARGKVTFPSISKLAEDDEIRDLLWTESAKLVKINGEKIFRNGDPNK